jgi:glycosyltransferase involved in cell wall biosynthesis
VSVHVAFVTTSYPRTAGDPSGHFVQTEARARARRGDTVFVLAPAHGPASGGGGGDEPGGVHLRWLPGGDAFGPPGALERLREQPARALAVARFVSAARHALRSLGRLDEIVAHWMMPSAFPIVLPTLRARVALEAMLEVTVHGSDGALFEHLPRPVRHRMAAILAARSARVRCVSEDLRGRLVRAAPALEPLCHVARAAIDVSGAPTREAARRALGIGEGERIAVVASRLISSKRPYVAVRLALSRGPSRVVVLGDGPLAPAVARLAPSVTALGQRPRPEALAWIAAADLVVSASPSEGAPTVIREARALGVPVLAVPAGDLRAWAATDPGIELIDL